MLMSVEEPILLGKSLVEAIRTCIVVDSDKSTSRVDIVVDTTQAVPITLLTLGKVGLVSFSSYFVGKVVHRPGSWAKY